ncbi:MAG TPA: serine hydrolase [Terriglobales bacterium]|nr:serine hydrolase [Terriglobales bacterium]
MLKRFSTLIAILITCLPAFAQNTARMDEIAKYYFETKQFMGSALVARGGDVVFDKSYGYANLEWQTPFAPDTKFRLGSITKQFTAVSILLLQERGQLNVNDPIKKYLPDAPAAWDGVTLHHLLTHTSGIPNFTDGPEYALLKFSATTPEKTMKVFWDKPLEFQPGERYKYCNSGYILLGYVVEKVSGKAYADFLQENIFKPLGMAETGYDSNTAILPHRAIGYVPTNTGLAIAEYVNMTVPFAAGGLYSTTRDLVKWEEGLFGGKVISAASLKQMTTPFKGGYGYGVWIHDGGSEVSHGGGIEGFNTDLRYFPQEKLTVVVLSNLNGPAHEVGEYVAKVARGKAVVLPIDRKEVKLSATTLQRYVGKYEIQPGFVLAVTLEGDQLMTQATGQVKLPIFAETDTRFFLKIVKADLEFVSGQDGKVTHAMLYQNGAEMKCVRIE